MTGRSKKFGFWLLVLIVGLIFVALSGREKTGFDSFVFNITYPLLVAAHSVTNCLHSIVEHRASYAELIQTNRGLEAENKLLIEENIKLAASLNFEARSRDLVEFQERYNLNNALCSKILVKNFSDEEHYFLVNRGKRDGIVKDMVALYKFQIVGKVSEIYECYSKVVLISDKTCKIAAYTNQGGHQGICQGVNIINNCLLTYVNHLATLQSEDLLFSSGQGLVFPEGYCLGKIESFESQNLYQQAIITPLIDFTTLDFCLVIGLQDIPAP